MKILRTPEITRQVQEADVLKTEIIRRIKAELPEVLLLADRIGVMRRGRLLQVLNKDAASETLILSLAAGTHT